MKEKKKKETEKQHKKKEEKEEEEEMRKMNKEEEEMETRRRRRGGEGKEKGERRESQRDKRASEHQALVYEEGARALKTKVLVFYNRILEFTFQTSCGILFLRSESFILAYTQGGGGILNSIS